jgi:signal peptidase I
MELQSESAPPQPWWKVVLVGRNPRRTFYRIIVLVAVCVVVFKFILIPVRIDGISMLPTLKSDSINFVNRFAYVFHEPRRGDIVAVHLRAGPHVMYMKRIVGLPGETLAFRHGILFINGKAMLEPYMKLPSDWDVGPQVIDKDKYYVVGDNRTMNPGDHTKGQAERKYIVGKAML